MGDSRYLRTVGDFPGPLIPREPVKAPSPAYR